MEYYSAIKKTVEAFNIRHDIEQSLQYGIIWEKNM